MNPECLSHVLTSEERERFHATGYLIVPDALSDAMVARLTAVVDGVDARERGEEQLGKLLSVPNIVHEDQSLVELLDWPTTFPKVWGILGWNIYLYHSHLDVTPPANAEQQQWSVAWHQDSMRVNDEIESKTASAALLESWLLPDGCWRSRSRETHW